MDNILELDNISKEFPGVKALSDITLNVERGEILAIVGENGAGKSTMMKILSGVYPYGTYGGSFRMNGTEMRFAGIRESEDAGIQIIYQELALCKLLDIADNIFLGNEQRKKTGFINKEEQIKQAKKYLSMVGMDIDPLTPVIQLGIGQQQLVEIAKAISKNAKVLILDEPTAPLTEAESENLFGIIRRLRESGVTCIFITHKLNEVFALADRITVIRDGSVVVTKKKEEFTEDEIIAHMVGREITDRFPKERHVRGEVVVSVRDWTVIDPELPTRKLVDNVSFEIRKGEVLGIAGLMGAGRTELALSLFGCYKGYTKGEISIDGKPVHIKEPRTAIKHGISYVSEDRKRYGLNLGMDILDNMTIASLDKITKCGVINNVQKIKAVDRMVENMKIKTPSNEQIVANLSGGNQQKVVLGKWLLTEPRVLILDEPTRGIDVGAKYEIYKIMNRLVNDGVCVIMISSELPEVLGMSDRVIIMHEGKITAELDNTDLSQEKVMYFATGGE
jgi:ABC-type sugar transport system ATPase subunit